MKIFWKTNLTKLVSMKHHIFRFWQMLQAGIVNNIVMRRCWRCLEKMKSLELCCNIKTFGLQLVFRHQHPASTSPLACTYHSSHQHFLLFGHILYFQKHFHQKYFLPIIFLCQGQLNDNQDPAGVGLSVLLHIMSRLCKSQELLLRVKLSVEC